jgi:hypothetical protein
MTIDEDVAHQIRQLMSERGSGFKETVNELLRRGLRSNDPVEPYEPPRFRSGVHLGIDLTHALRLAGDLDDAEFVRKLEMGK